MVLAAISWNSVGLIVSLQCRINSKVYLNILGDHVHPIDQVLFSDGDGIFQDKNVSIQTAHVVKNCHKKHESVLERMEWPPQSSDLNIIEHSWCVFERQVKNLYPPPSYLLELE